MSEIYVSTDVEVDGPIPGPHSMLSFGSAAYLADKTLVSTFAVNLQTLPGATSHPETMAWWARHREAWEASRRDPRLPAKAVADYIQWLEELPGKPVFVGYPAAFDFMFVYWYLMRFAGRSPFSFSALDIKTMAMVMLGEDYRRVAKKKMPKDWFDELPHSHVALQDAIEQGALFCNMLAQSRRLVGVTRAPIALRP
jgi:hypothetical protein